MTIALLIRRRALQQVRRNNTSFDIMLNLALLASDKAGSDREWYIYPRSTHWAHCLFHSPRHYFVDVEFQTTFRMSRDSFETLHQLLQRYIEKPDTRFRKAIPSNIRLAIFLYHITLGVPYTAVCNQFGVGKTSVSRIVGQVALAICQNLSKLYIRMPSCDEAFRSMEFWRRQIQIPGIVACIDGCHIPISRPCASGNGYYNRKGFYSLNVQGISRILSCERINEIAAVDHKKRFVDLTVGWPGSVADSRVWVNSSLNRKAEDFLSQLPSTAIATKVDEASETRTEVVPAFILADSAYANTSRVVTTYKTTECSESAITKRLNRKLASVRYCIENAFGICKGRFRILNRPLECAAEDINRAIMLIVSIFTVHNFLIEEHDETEIQLVERSENERFQTARGDDSTMGLEDEDTLDSTRNVLWRHMYWLQFDRDNDEDNE